MSLLTHTDALATHATRFSGGSADALSSILLIVSGLAVGAAGIGLVILCARALFAKKAAPQPWMAAALSSPTLHTRKFVEAELEASEAVSALEAIRQIEVESPLSDPDADAGPVTIRLPPTAPDATPPAPVPALPAPSADALPLSGRGPSSADPTLEMDTRAFGSSVTSDNDVEPVEVTPPSEPTDTEVFLGSPIPLVARKGTAGQTLEIFPAPVEETPVPTSDGREPMAVHRSGTVPKADPAFMRTLPSFNDGARRA
jgi:hypothetical protein